MATQQLESSISSEAMDLLTCFAEDLGSVVYEIAEGIAREKLGGAADQSVHVEKADMAAAGRLFFEWMEQLLASRQISASARPAIEHMKSCFERKSRSDA